MGYKRDNFGSILAIMGLLLGQQQQYLHNTDIYIYIILYYIILYYIILYIWSLLSHGGSPSHHGFFNTKIFGYLGVAPF